MITFEVEGEPPQPKQRPRFSRRGKKRTSLSPTGKIVVKTTPVAYTPDKTVAYEKLVRDTAWLTMHNEKEKLIEGPVCLEVSAFFAIPESFKGRERILAEGNVIRPTGKPDWDNIGKLVSDALNGIAYKDDSQVVACEVTKRYAPWPRILVSVYRL